MAILRDMVLNFLAVENPIELDIIVLYVQSQGEEPKNLRRRLKRLLMKLIRDSLVKKVEIDGRSLFCLKEAEVQFDKPMSNVHLQQAILQAFRENDWDRFIRTSLTSLVREYAAYAHLPSDTPDVILSMASTVSVYEKTTWTLAFQKMMYRFGLSVEDLHVLIHKSEHVDVPTAQIQSCANEMVLANLLVSDSGRFKIV